MWASIAVVLDRSVATDMEIGETSDLMSAKLNNGDFGFFALIGPAASPKSHRGDLVRYYIKINQINQYSSISYKEI